MYASGTKDDHPLLSENLDQPPQSHEKEVGCRKCSWLMFVKYLIVVLIAVVGAILIFAAPKHCPSDYTEETCESDGHTYSCRDGGRYCASKIPDSGFKDLFQHGYLLVFLVMLASGN